jgi:penicillin-binding protein 1A
LNRDGSLLEEWKETTSKVTSEYVALTMVEMMQGVTRPGGTRPAQMPPDNRLQAKPARSTTRLTFGLIGFTPTYVTGVWMGNPEKKANLGRGMTGGQGALPYFNAFMSQFMKGKEKETFPKPPPIPSDIKALAEQRRREELEKTRKSR